MGILEGIFVSAENVSGIIVIPSCTLFQFIQTGTCSICIGNTRTDTKWNINRTVHLIAVYTSVGKIRSHIEMVHRLDDKLRGIGEVEFLVIVLVLAHGKYNLSSIGYIIVTADDERVVVKASSVRIEERERGRSVAQVAEHVLNIAYTDPRIIGIVE